MLAINKNAPCTSCLVKLKVKQDIKNEESERWYCKFYNEIPTKIIQNIVSCKYYKSDT